MFIFINFITSTYFRRPTDEYIYFRRLSGYFRRFLADENKLFSYSDRGEDNKHKAHDQDLNKKLSIHPLKRPDVLIGPTVVTPLNFSM
jgi:hypothetical protein